MVSHRRGVFLPRPIGVLPITQITCRVSMTTKSYYIEIMNNNENIVTLIKLPVQTFIKILQLF